jgi:beta-galactosidase/beta-glucuronidase
MELWLNFGAVDYKADVYVNGEHVTIHTGGSSSFAVCISSYIGGADSFTLTVRAEDVYDFGQPRGKQHWLTETDRCWYTATTGIWQNVWMEGVHGIKIEHALITPDVDNKCADVQLYFDQEIKQGIIEWELIYKDRSIKNGSFTVKGFREKFKMHMEEEDPIDNLLHLWSPENPNLYYVRLTLKIGEQIQDKIQTYFGMRKIERRGNKTLLNNYPLYQKLILDQGYWPDSLMTPPSAEALVKDLQLVKDMGFNGVRKHQKIEDPRFYYYADIMGVLVWSEMPSMYEFHAKGAEVLTKEWTEIIYRDYNHPSIVTWVPLNESWGVRDILHDVNQQSFALSLYYLTKALDGTRLVSSNDGWETVTSDICGIHDYEGYGEALFDKMNNVDTLLEWTAVGKMLYANNFKYNGEPVLLSEFGGIAFEDKKSENWGYSGKVKDEDEFLKRFASLFEAINKLKYLSGFCYTQLTDVEQESNGLLDGHRKAKVSIEKIKKVVDGCTSL